MSDISYICDCGEAIDDDTIVNARISEHEAGRDHVVAVMRRFTSDDWNNLRKCIYNGLGWAESESMSSWDMDHDKARAVLDELIDAYRVSLGVPA